MIEGSIDADLQPFLVLAVRGPKSHSREVVAIVDTGFNGFLTLPSELVTELDLPFVTRGRATLADGRVEVCNVYYAFVLWSGSFRVVEAAASGPECLVGMALLEGHDLWMRVTPGGPITIQPSRI